MLLAVFLLYWVSTSFYHIHNWFRYNSTTTMMVEMRIPLPPEKFDKPYTGELILIEMPLEKVHSACGGSKSSLGRIWACAAPITPNKCLVILPKIEKSGITKHQYARLKRHEIGHCNGWGGDHSGGRFD